jgi:hypothetical protein
MSVVIDIGLASALREASLLYRGQDELHRLRGRLALSRNPLEWVEQLIPTNIPTDVGRPLTFKGREFWRPIYRDGGGRRVVVMSAAQVGKSIMDFYLITSLAHLDYYQGRGVWIGMYLPTQEMVRVFSQARFRAILTAIGERTGLQCGDARPADVGTQRKGQIKSTPDSYNLKRIGPSWILLGWMQGQGVDAFPLDRLLLDEVRLMDPSRVDRVEKRIMASALGTIAYTSTAGMPGDALDVRWEQSTQYRFHHACRCKDGIVLPDAWPNCLGERKGDIPEGEERYYLFCPRCGQRIVDRSAGRWIAHNESGRFPGYNPTQLMTAQPIDSIAEAFFRPDSDRGEFTRSVLGQMWMDKDSVPITQEILDACCNEDLLWAEPGETVNACMGIDQMGQNNYYVVAVRAPNGKRRIVHLEVVWDDDPWTRGAQLMREYDVSVCLTEPNPNYNDAIKFANAHKGRVFIVTFANNDSDPRAIRWGDRPDGQENPKDRKTASALRIKHSVMIHRSRTIDLMTQAWADRAIETPNKKSLLQKVLDPYGREFTASICEDLYHDHLQRMAKRRISKEFTGDGMDIAEKTGEVTVKWGKLARAPGRPRPLTLKGDASDPHFFFADMLCHIAWTRLPQGRKVRAAWF